MNGLIKFEPGTRLPTVAEAKLAIDKCETVEEVRQIDSIYEAARAYAAKIGDLYKQADAAEVKKHAARRIGLIYETSKNPVGRPKENESGGDSLTTRQIINGLGISADKLQEARVLGRMTTAQFDKHVADTRDRIINKAARKAAVETAKTFDQRSKVINMHLREFLTHNEPIGRDLQEIIRSIDKFDTPSDIDQIMSMMDNCKRLAVRAAELASKLETVLMKEGKIING